MKPGLSLIGSGMDSCVIKLEFISTAVTMADSCILEGFNVIVPDTYNTLGVDADFNGKGGLVTLCRIKNASLGIYVGNNDTKVYKNIFDKIKSRGVNLFNSNSITRLNYVFTDPNDEFDSYAVYIEAFNNNYSPTIDSNYIETHGEGIRKSFGSRPIIVNNTIIKKKSYSGIFLSYSDSAKVNNNLIISESGSGRCIKNGGTPYLQLYNNYISVNPLFMTNYFAIETGPNNKLKQNVIVDAKRGIYAGATQNLAVQYNNLWNVGIKYSGFTADSTNISVDPMLVNDDSLQGELDFHLQKYSPLIDVGDPTMIDKDNSRIDMGLYGGLYGEIYNYLDKAPKPPRNLTALVDTNKVILRWNRNTEADTAYYKVYRDTVVNFTIDSTKLVSTAKDTFLVQAIPNRVSRYVYKVTCVDYAGNESKASEEAVVNLTSINDYPMTISDYLLYQNYPNPFNPKTKIGYKLNEGGYVKLYVYDIKGELIEVLVNENQQSGYYEVEFDGNNYSRISSGVYIYQLMVKSGNNIPLFSDIKKMIYLR
jgi:hypothetical protein